MKELKVNDQIMHRYHTSPIFILVTSVGLPVKWNGQSVDNELIVKDRRFYKNGKWSYNEYILAMNDNATLIKYNKDWNRGKFLPATKDEVIRFFVSQAPNVDIPKLLDLLYELHPEEMAEIDERERKLLELEEAGEVMVKTINVSNDFEEYVDEQFVLAPSDVGWREPIVVKGNVEVLEVCHVRGMRGGWYTIKLGIKKGVEYG
ncbi:MAG: hypothetical protein QXS54_09510 [Candidatus Methanomethylicaceae archaeon]